MPKPAAPKTQDRFQNFRGSEEPHVSKEAAIRYAHGAGFTVDGNIAGRDDMNTVFRLREIGPNLYIWYRDVPSYSKRN
jgi:hypothetical protein